MIIGLLGTGLLVEGLESDLNLYLQQLEINEKPFDWTLRTAGTALLYTVSTGGKVVTKISAGVAVGLGYPIAVISGIVAVSSGIYSLGPCAALDALPNIRTLSGFAKIVFSPSVATLEIADAALCPASLSTCVTATTVALISYSIARCSRRAFNS